MKVEEAVKDFVCELEMQGYSPRTIRTYEVILNCFARWTEADVEDLTHSDFRKYAQHMLKEGRKGSYVNQIITCCKSFCSFLNEEYETNIKCSSINFVKEEQPVIKTLQPEDIKKLLSTCKDKNSFLDCRDRAIIVFFIDSGIRCLELQRIKEEDIFDDCILIHGKNSKDRFIPITQPMRRAMRQYERAKKAFFARVKSDAGEYYFCSRAGNFLDNPSIRQMFHRRGEGIDSSIRLTPHTLRHTFSQLSVKQGMDIKSLSVLLGHANMSITARYLDSMSAVDIVKEAKNKSIIMGL